MIALITVAFYAQGANGVVHECKLNILPRVGEYVCVRHGAKLCKVVQIIHYIADNRATVTLEGNI